VSPCTHWVIAFFVQTLTGSSAGVPQIILPQWGDLYDIAQVAETIGVGVWGCPETSPDWTATCLEHAFSRVLHDGPTSRSIIESAAAFGDLATSMGPGRDAAARVIAKLAASGHA
jgi:UDP:flavonoid glycosyltransferase YjiC (YdhE family)